MLCLISSKRSLQFRCQIFTLLSVELMWNFTDMEEAIAAFRKATDLRPDDAEGHDFLALGLTVAGICDESLQESEKAIALNGSAGNYYSNSVFCLLEEKRNDEAELRAKKAIELDPKSPSFHVNLAAVYIRKHQPAATIAEYKNAINLDPDKGSTYVTFATYLIVQGYPEEGIKVLKLGAYKKPDYGPIHSQLGWAYFDKENFTESEKEFENAVELDPDNGNGHAGLGWVILKTTNNQQKSEAEFRKALELNLNEVEAHHGLGSIFYLEGKLQDSVTELREAERLAPKNPNIHHDLGYALSGLEQWDQASTELRQAITSDSNLTLYTALGKALYKAHHQKEAVEEFKKVIAKQPDDLTSNFYLALSYIELGLTSEAFPKIDKVYLLDPNNPGLSAQFCASLFAAKMYSDAIPNCQKALASTKTANPDLSSHIFLVLSYLGSNSRAAALAEMDKVYLLAPNDSQNPTLFCASLFNAKLYSDAIPHCRKALAVSPKDGLTHSILGTALLETGSKSEGTKELQKAHELDPTIDVPDLEQ